MKEDQVWNISLESVLVHHQDSVSSLQWALNDEAYFSDSDLGKGQDTKVRDINEIQLLSSSFDFTVCVWQNDVDTK